MKRPSGRPLLTVLLALALAALLPGCAPRETTPTRPAEWTVLIAEPTGGGDPLSDYGTNAQYYLTWHVVEPDGKSWGVVNDLAEQWSFPDSTTFRVELKRGVQFHNGEELTAEHVKYAYDSIVYAEKPGRRTATLKPLGEAEILDAYTIQWRMAAPNSTIIGVLNLMAIPPLARRDMTAEEFERRPIGTGPYRVAEWPRDGTVRLEAWDGYRRGKPFPERLVVRSVPEPSTRVLELLAGSAQIAQVVPIEAIPSIQENPRLDVVSVKGSFTVSYVMNIFKTSPPLRDKRIRQAMNYAIDREAIVRSILGGRGTTLPGPLSPGWLGYTDSVKPYTYDPERAKALLREAGYPDGFAMKWTVTQGVFVKDIEIAQAVASQLGRVGINVTLQPLERARLLAERNEGDYDMTELGWPFGWHPALMFDLTLHAAYQDARLAPKWGDPPEELVEARRLVRQAAAATSIDGMATAYAALSRLVQDEAFWLFVHTNDDLWGVQRDTGWRPYPNLYPVWYDYWGLQGKPAPSDPTVPLLLQ